MLAVWYLYLRLVCLFLVAYTDNHGFLLGHKQTVSACLFRFIDPFGPCLQYIVVWGLSGVEKNPHATGVASTANPPVAFGPCL